MSPTPAGIVEWSKLASRSWSRSRSEGKDSRQGIADSKLYSDVNQSCIRDQDQGNDLQRRPSKDSQQCCWTSREMNDETLDEQTNGTLDHFVEDIDQLIGGEPCDSHEKVVDIDLYLNDGDYEKVVVNDGDDFMGA